MEITFHDILKVNGYEKLLDSITSAILLLDKDFQIVNANEAFASIFFKTKEEVVGNSLGETLKCSYSVEEDKECMLSKFCNFCEFKMSITESFIDSKTVLKKLFSSQFYIGDEKKLKHFQYSIRPLKYNESVYSLIIMDDFTELFFKSDLLQDALKRKNELLSIAVHDIRNPLSNVKSYLDLIINSNKPISAEEISENLSHINESIGFSLKLVDDIIDSSTLNSGDISLSQTKQNYADFVEEIADIFSTFALQKQINIETEIVDRPDVFFDATKIQQVFDNLLNNAIKYSSEYTTIIIKVYIKDTNVVTEIHDQGKGITEEDQDELFNYFIKQNSNSKEENNTGLGLSIAKRIIRKHRGNIGVESNINKGTVFTFTLPYQ